MSHRVPLMLLLLCFASSCSKDISGEYSGWGNVVIKGNEGTYSDTYGTGPGTFKFKKVDTGYQGTWGESAKRHGVFNFTLSDDGRTISGAWRADNDCAIQPGGGGVIDWKRK